MMRVGAVGFGAAMGFGAVGAGAVGFDEAAAASSFAVRTVVHRSGAAARTATGGSGSALAPPTGGVAKPAEAVEHVRACATTQAGPIRPELAASTLTSAMARVGDPRAWGGARTARG